MNEIVKLYKEHPVRIVDRGGEPWFVVKDVCAVLEIAKVDSAIRSLDEDEKDAHSMSTLGGDQKMTVVSEAGLYSLILRSHKPEAKAFKRWVTHEVLPAIRKTGTYSCDPVVRKFVDEVQKKALAQVRRDLAAARNAAITSLQKAGYSVDANIISTFTLHDCSSNDAMLKQQQHKIIRQIVDPRFIATVKMEIESKEN